MATEVKPQLGFRAERGAPWPETLLVRHAFCCQLAGAQHLRAGQLVGVSTSCDSIEYYLPQPDKLAGLCACAASHHPRQEQPEHAILLDRIVDDDVLSVLRRRLLRTTEAIRLATPLKNRVVAAAAAAAAAAATATATAANTIATTNTDY
ncbi:hypothetical protein PG987_011184 [Apiospora arundinis]